MGINRTGIIRMRVAHLLGEIPIPNGALNSFLNLWGNDIP